MSDQEYEPVQIIKIGNLQLGTDHLIVSIIFLFLWIIIWKANNLFAIGKFTIMFFVAYILVEIFVLWILLSIMLFYSKKIIFSIPNPFTDLTLTKINFDYTLIIVLMPIIISCGIRNMRTKSQYLYDDIEHFFTK